jgi:uncharacterized protein YcaQ
MDAAARLPVPLSGLSMTERTISIRTARRAAVARQHLGGRPPAAPGASAILDVVRDLGCLQLDPIAVVARSHLLVLAARLGPFDPDDLERLLCGDRTLFEYWAHRASIVLTEDFAIHSRLMRMYGTGDRLRHQRLREWLAANDTLRRRIMTELRAKGPRRSRDLAGTGSVDWVSQGWTGGRNVSQMLDYLWTKGRIAVVGRRGSEKLWDLAERWYPAWAPRERLSAREVTARAAPRSLRSLGVATPKQIAGHFIPGRYADLPVVLERLRRRGEIVPVRVADNGVELQGSWFVHVEDLPLLDSLEKDEGWAPRTALLSPFDNLIWDRERAATLFGFDFRMEIYVPRTQRRFGYYTMPVLHGARIVAIADPVMDHATRTLRVNALHTLPGAPKDRRTGRAIDRAIGELATFLGAAATERAPT